MNIKILFTDFWAILNYKFVFFTIGLLLTLSLLWPLVASPYFTMHDDVQWVRLYEMDTCFKDFQIPCRWVPDLGGEYGYPLFNYYAPLPYYFGEIFYFLTHQLIFSAKIMFAAPFIGCFIFMYLFARKIWGEIGGVTSAIFYSFLPYHALDFYVRGAMGELWGLMFYPAIFWALIRLKEKMNITNALILALTAAGLAVSHNLSTLIFVPFLVLIVITFLIYEGGFSKDRNLFKSAYIRYLIIAAAIAFLLAAFYLLPVLVEKDLVHVDTTISGYFHYTEHFKGLKKLFLDRDWGYGASQREYPGSPTDGLSYQIGWMHLVAWVLAIFSGILLWRKHRSRSILIILSSISIVGAIYMIHPLSVWIWNLIPALAYVQFPWRFLGIVGFFICFLAGSIIYTLLEIHLDHKRVYTFILLFLLVAGVVIFNFNYFIPDKFVYMTDAQALEGSIWDVAIKRSIFDYLPIYAKAPPAELALTRYTILSGDSIVSNFHEGTDWINFDVHTNKLTFLQLSQYYFPQWKIYTDGKLDKINYQNPLGLMSIFLDPGDHHVSARLYNSPIRTISNILTFFGILVALFIWLYRLKITHRFLSYLAKGLNK